MTRHAELDFDVHSGNPSWPELVDRLKSGQASAMEELYHVFVKGVRFYLYRQIGPQDLDDHIHDLFLVVTQSILKGELREPERLMGYVRTVVRRQVAAQIDESVHARHNQAEIDAGFRQIGVVPSPEGSIIRKQHVELAKRVLTSLAPRDREVLERFYLDEQSAGEICKDMELSETQFRLIKSRAKLRFQELAKRRLRLRTAAKWYADGRQMGKEAAPGTGKRPPGKKYF